METGICSDLGERIDRNVDSCTPETGTNGATGTAHRRRHGDPSPRVPFCFSSSEHDKLAALLKLIHIQLHRRQWGNI